ncbi:MAG TPA: phosphoglucosamine mutase [bacterium]|nr:phosphoglucosamine mutase [bacterium]HPQ17891.1 phosphoglucosamine mutase [bacterium]
MGKLFGTDGIRGIANIYPMTADVALEVGRAVAYIFKQKKGSQHKILIGKDTRLSCYMLETALTAGICSMGADAFLIGPIPTPGVAFLTGSMRSDAGIMISASHNPFQDNGIKIFTRDGFKLPDEIEERIEELILSKKLEALQPTAGKIGKAHRIEDALGRYIEFLKHTFPKEFTLENLRIAIDCANGATYKVAPTVFSELDAEIFPINIKPDGININLNCGALHTERLKENVLKTRADIGLAFDGDGDRFIAIDEKGQEVSGDKIIAICAKYLKEKNKLKNNAVVTTVMSNLGLSVLLKELGIKHYKSKVGDRYVLEEMLKNDVILGGEDSGHIIFLEHHTTGDGILSALQLLAIMVETNKRLSELAAIMETYPQILINVDVSSKPDLNSIPEIVNVIKESEEKLKDRGRVLVRYSGTEMLCRVMVEGPTHNEIKQIAEEIVSIIKSKLS